METYFNIKALIAVLVYSALGIVILWGSFKAFDAMTPGNLWKEVVEEKNIALAITTAAMILAIAHIISAAIHG